MTTTTETTTTDRTRALFGCPSWCSVDHNGSKAPDAGEHVRALAGLYDADDSIDLVDGPWRSGPEAQIWLGGNNVLDLPANPETAERMRVISEMFKHAAEQLADVLPELEATQ